MNNYEMVLVIGIINSFAVLFFWFNLFFELYFSFVPLYERFLVTKDCGMIILGQTEFLEFCYL